MFYQWKETNEQEEIINQEVPSTDIEEKSVLDTDTNNELTNETPSIEEGDNNGQVQE